MALSTTMRQMKSLLSDIIMDLEKTENGNKAASQRVRTGTVKLEKIAKTFRKESIVADKKMKGKPAAKKKAAAKKKPAAKKKAAPKKKPVAKKAAAKKPVKKAAPKKKPAAKKPAAKKAMAKKPAAKKAVAKKPMKAAAKKPAAKKAAAKKPVKKAASSKKAKTAKTTARPRAMVMRRPTAKLPMKKSRARR